MKFPDPFSIQQSEKQDSESPLSYCVICREAIWDEEDVEEVTAGKGECIIFGPAHWEGAGGEKEECAHSIQKC